MICFLFYSKSLQFQCFFFFFLNNPAPTDIYPFPLHDPFPIYHAVVAQNVLKHPFKPTLVDIPYLPYDHWKWGENHVWLHKPILPFWQVALSLALLGVNAFALDRKSTRLNSSHLVISYAVFCLK